MKIEISKLTNQDKVDRKMPKVKFSNFSNMKIEINKSQSLDEVVRVLERLGYKLDYECEGKPTFIITWQLGFYDIQSMSENELVGHAYTTTLAELKEM